MSEMEKKIEQYEELVKAQSVGMTEEGRKLLEAVVIGHFARLLAGCVDAVLENLKTGNAYMEEVNRQLDRDAKEAIEEGQEDKAYSFPTSAIGAVLLALVFFVQPAAAQPQSRPVFPPVQTVEIDYAGHRGRWVLYHRPYPIGNFLFGPQWIWVPSRPTAPPIQGMPSQTPAISQPVSPPLAE